MAKKIQVTFDCADPGALAHFWAAVLGYRLQEPPPGFATWDEAMAAFDVPRERWNDASAVIDPDGVGPRLFFQRVPEGKQVKNRVHLDLTSPDLDAEVARLVGAGATQLADQSIEGSDFRWVTLSDPDGNVFCVSGAH